MKTTSPFLWQLIQSMTNAEKLYFKRNFLTTRTTTTSTLYIRLFNAIASQKKYNEPSILLKFGPALNKKNISYQKHYLQQLVTQAIIKYDGINDYSQEIYNQILQIRIYKKKGLLNEAHNIWKKAVQKARQNEAFALLNLLKTEFEKMVLLSNSHTKYDELHSLFKSNKISYLAYADLITLRDIYAETILLKRKAHFDIDNKLKEKINSLLQVVDRYTGVAAISSSFWFHHYYHMNKATLLYLLNDIPSSLNYLKIVLKSWEAHPGFISTHGEYYIELLYMINYTGILHKDYEYVTTSFNLPMNEKIKEPVQKANFEAIKYLAFNKIYNKTAQYAEVDGLLRLMKIKYKQWEPLLNSDLNRTINLSMGIASFVLEQYVDALFFTKRGITFFKDGTRDEHSSVAHILLLLITYSVNNQKLFDAQYRATYTYFYKRKNKHPFETALVQCLHRSFYMTDLKSKMSEYNKALKICEDHKNDTVQQMAFSIFNYPGWLQSKTQRISYRQFVEKKVKAELTTAL